MPATLRVAVAFAAEGCSRIPPPLPLKPSESKGSGGLPFQAFAAVWGLCGDSGRFAFQSFVTALGGRNAPKQKPNGAIDAISEAR